MPNANKRTIQTARLLVETAVAHLIQAAGFTVFSTVMIDTEVFAERARIRREKAYPNQQQPFRSDYSICCRSKRC